MKKQNNKGHLAWNLEILNSELRAPQIVEVTGELLKPEGCTSSVYKYTNLENGKWYVGYHKESKKPYYTSTTNKEFQEVLANPNSKLKIEILHWGSVKECKQVEYEILTKENAKDNDMSYNLHNGHPGVQQLNLKSTNTLVEEINILRKHQNIDHEFSFLSEDGNFEIFKVEELINIPGLQTRSLQIDVENLTKIKDRIANNIGTYDCPVLVKNVTIDGVFYEYILISGNHTREAYWGLRKSIPHMTQKELKCVVIDEDVHSNFQEAELIMISNDLNSDYNVGKPFSVGDAVLECLEYDKQGYSWKTKEMSHRFQLRGLTSNQVNTVWDKTLDSIEKQQWEAAGKIILDYANKNSDKLQKKVEDFYDDDTFTLSCASGAPTLDRWMNAYIDHQMVRIIEGKSVQSKIKVIVFHTSTKNKEAWPEMFRKITKPQHLEPKFKKSLNGLVKLPHFEWHQMPMTGNSIQK